jgi:hypothetical protein
VEETANRQKLGLLRMKVTLEKNIILFTNEESGLIWKSYIVGEKSCTASKRERVSQDYTAILQTAVLLCYAHSKCGGFDSHSRLFGLCSFVCLQVSFPTNMSYVLTLKEAITL